MFNHDDLDTLVKEYQVGEKVACTEKEIKNKNNSSRLVENNENPHIDNPANVVNPANIPEPGKNPGNFLVINLEEISNNNKVLENSEVLFAIYEVTTNSNYYGLNLSNKSRCFWDRLTLMKCFEKILASFKSETLRKYWRTLSEISNQKKVLDTIKKHSKAINSTNMKLLTIITLLKDFLSGRIVDFEKTLGDAPEKNVPKIVTEKKCVKNKSKDDDESFEIEDKKMLNKKRKNPNEEVISGINKKIEIINNVINSGNEVKQNESGGLRRSSRAKTNNSLFSEEDKKIFAEIETIVKILQEVVPEVSEYEIWEALKRNSFNIINTYLFLNEPELYDGNSFI